MKSTGLEVYYFQLVAQTLKHNMKVYREFKRNFWVAYISEVSFGIFSREKFVDFEENCLLQDENYTKLRDQQTQNVVTKF